MGRLLLITLVATLGAGSAHAQPPGEVDPLVDARITFLALTVGSLPAERDDRWSLHAQAGADARGDLDGTVGGGELGIAAELHRGTAECIRSVDLSGQVRLGAGDVPGLQHAARAQACFAGWHILRELSLGLDGNVLPPLSLGRGVRSLPIDRVTFGGGFAMLSIAMPEGSIEIMPGTFAYEDLGQAAPGEPETHVGNFHLELSTFAVREAGEGGGMLDVLFVGIHEMNATEAGPGAAALTMGLLRLGGMDAAGLRFDGDLSLQVGQIQLDDGPRPGYLTVTTGGGTFGVERRKADHQASLRYRRGFSPSPTEVILEDRVDASLTFPQPGARLGLRGFAAWTRAWTAPGGPQHRGLTGGGAVDWTRSLPHRSQLAISAELARSYYAELGPAEPAPSTGARLLVVLATELAGSRK